MKPMHKILSLMQCGTLLMPSLLSAAAGVEGRAATKDAMGSDTIASSKPFSTIMGGISLPKNTITMDFQDADVRDIFRLLAIKSGLNVIYGADVSGTMTIHLDQVPFDEAFQTVLTLKGLVALPMGPRVIRVVTSSALTSEQSNAATFTRVFHINYALAEDIKRPLDAIRTAANRKGVSTVDQKTNSLIVTDTQEGLKEVEDLIPILDKKTPQVDIESKIVEVSLDNETQTGISWQYALGRSGDKTFVGASKTASGNGSGVGGSPTNGVAVVGPGDGGTGVSLNNVTSTGFSFLTQQGAYILAAQIAALSQQNKVKVLSNPHIVTANNAEATMNVVSKFPYFQNTLTNGFSQPSINFIEAGVKLTVKPTINADRGITLKVKPEVSNPVGSALPGSPPTVNSRNAETTVVLLDGETIAIGGLITEQTTKSTNGVPLLMNIPVIGYLFKQTDNRKTRVELIIFLTPRIVGE